MTYVDCVIQEKKRTGSTFTTSFSTAPSLYLLPAITSTENFKSIFVFLASSNMEMALFILVMHRHSCKLVGWLLMIGWNKKWAYKFYAFLCRYMECFVWNIIIVWLLPGRFNEIYSLAYLINDQHSTSSKNETNFLSFNLHWKLMYKNCNLK